MKTKIKKRRKFFLKHDDLVQVISGKDRGKNGKILKIDKKNDRLCVEGIALQQKHQKPTQKNQKGKMVKKEGAIHYSNVLLYNAKTKKGERICIEGVAKNKKRIFVSERTKTKNVEQ